VRGAQLCRRMAHPPPVTAFPVTGKPPPPDLHPLPSSRETHASPFDFLQLRRPNKIQRLDTGLFSSSPLPLTSPVFMLRLSRSFHRWERVKLPSCQMCNSARLLAAFFCPDCNKNFCRPCFRRSSPSSLLCSPPLAESTLPTRQPATPPTLSRLLTTIRVASLC
jgi:hypothetical protein